MDNLIGFYSYLENNEMKDENLIDDNFLDLSSLYDNVISNKFLDFIVSECNIFSIKKLLKQETINNIQKYIYNYNKHVYRTIEDYHLDVNTIQERVNRQINDIEDTLYNVPLFEKKILDLIYDFSIQKYEIYQYIEYETLIQLYYILPKLKKFIHYSDIYEVNDEEEYLYDKTHFKMFENISREFDIGKLLLYNNDLILTDNFIFYLIDTLFERLNHYNFEKNFESNGVIYDKNVFKSHVIIQDIYSNIELKLEVNHYKYIILVNIIENLTKTNKYFSNDMIDYLYNKLKEIGVRNNDKNYSKILKLSENIEEILLHNSYDIDIDYEYIFSKCKLSNEIIELFILDKKFTENMWEKLLNNNYYLSMLRDDFLIKYKTNINITKLIVKKECSLDLLNGIKDLFTLDDWKYIFNNYKNLPETFLLENHNYLLIYLYRENIDIKNKIEEIVKK